MKKKNILFVFLIGISFSFFLSPINVNAYNRLGTGKISGGAQNILYWRDSSINEYSSSIDYGFSYWNGHTTKVQSYRTTTQSYSRCDVYWGNYFPVGSETIAMTELMLGSSITYDYDNDWYWCRIKFNENQFNYDEMDYYDRQGTACHEYGHFLGLAHNYSTNSVMCQLAEGRTVCSPSTDDINGIKAIYGS